MILATIAEFECYGCGHTFGKSLLLTIPGFAGNTECTMGCGELAYPTGTNVKIQVEPSDLLTSILGAVGAHA